MSETLTANFEAHRKTPEYLSMLSNYRKVIESIIGDLDGNILKEEFSSKLSEKSIAKEIGLEELKAEAVCIQEEFKNLPVGKDFEIKRNHNLKAVLSA